MGANTIEMETRSGAEPEGLSIAGVAYERPELVELGAATSLLHGVVERPPYDDCGGFGYADYRPTC